MTNRVLLTEPIRPIGVEILQAEAEVVVAPDRREEAILEIIDQFDAMVCRTTRMDRKMIERASRMKAVARHGAGVDIIDVDAATENGMCVLYAPGSNSQSVAELVVAMMLALARNVIKGDYALRVERNYFIRDKLVGHNLENKVVGIVGMGQIGRRLAKICGLGFDMRVLGYDPWLTREDFKKMSGVEQADSLEQLLKESDYVSLNCPLTPDTKNLIGVKELSLMKETAFLLNLARGPIVEEDALIVALKNGLIAGAGLDMFWEEPPREGCQIFDLPNVITTPHIAAHAFESLDMMSKMVATDIVRVLRGEKPTCLANPHVWEHRKLF